MWQCFTDLTACNSKFSYYTQRANEVFERRSSPHLIVVGCFTSQLLPSVVRVALILATAKVYVCINGFKAE